MREKPNGWAKLPLWRQVLTVGLTLWLVSLAVLWTTRNPTLVPTVIFVGSFLTPVTLACWIVRKRLATTSSEAVASRLSVPLLVAAFMGMGVLGVAVSSLLEAMVPTSHQSVFYLGAAVIEESVKLAAVWWLARGLGTYTRRDGMVLGACVGFGFAAFESAGYAFDALIAQRSDTDRLLSEVASQVVRSVLTPVGHGLWTALLAGVLFATARGGRLRLTWTLVGWWTLVVLLHLVWDQALQVADAVAVSATRGGVTFADFEAGDVTVPPGWSQVLAAVLETAVLACCAVLGLWLARWQWRRGSGPGTPYR